MTSRRQVSLFVPEPERAAFDAVRRRFDPAQHALIPAHVTLVREDEVDDWTELARRLRAALPFEVRLRFGSVVRPGPNSVLLRCAGLRDAFEGLRHRLLARPGHEPRNLAPHLTLVHPRAATCDDEALAAIAAVELPVEVALTEARIIEQTHGGPWRTVERFGAVADEPPASDAYGGLTRAVGALTDSVAARRTADLECRRGCTACCHVQLTVSRVEADSVRAGLAALSDVARERVRDRTGVEPAPDGPCVLLEPDGGCAVYAHRPLVCRTQGHALAYPKGSLAPEAVFAETDAADVTWCPLNYTERAPKSEDVVLAQTIDEHLAAANRAAHPEDRGERRALRDLAAE